MSDPKNKPIDDKGPEIEPIVDAEEPIGDWQFITTVAATTVGIFFSLRTLGVGQYSALLASTLSVWSFSLPVWER